MEATERGQVLDGVALYGTELAVVVENKISARPGDWKVRSLNVGGFTLKFN